MDSSNPKQQANRPFDQGALRNQRNGQQTSDREHRVFGRRKTAGEIRKHRGGRDQHDTTDKSAERRRGKRKTDGLRCPPLLRHGITIEQGCSGQRRSRYSQENCRHGTPTGAAHEDRNQESHPRQRRQADRHRQQQDDAHERAKSGQRPDKKADQNAGKSECDGKGREKQLEAAEQGFKHSGSPRDVQTEDAARQHHVQDFFEGEGHGESHAQGNG